MTDSKKQAPPVSQNGCNTGLPLASEYHDEGWLHLNNSDAFDYWLKKGGDTTKRGAWEAGRLHYIDRLKLAGRAVVSKTLKSLLTDAQETERRVEELTK